jgi:hypothetical protein
VPFPSSPQWGADELQFVKALRKFTLTSPACTQFYTCKELLLKDFLAMLTLEKNCLSFLSLERCVTHSWAGCVVRTMGSSFWKPSYPQSQRSWQESIHGRNWLYLWLIGIQSLADEHRLSLLSAWEVAYVISFLRGRAGWNYITWALLPILFALVIF